MKYGVLPAYLPVHPTAELLQSSPVITIPASRWALPGRGCCHHAGRASPRCPAWLARTQFGPNAPESNWSWDKGTELASI